MIRIHVLVEGTSDQPAVREVLTRKFGLQENSDYKIHPHRGLGKLPSDLLGSPDPKHRGLLDLLPATLKGYSHLGDDCCMVVLVDVDQTPCTDLLAELQMMLTRLPKRPPNVLFRLAIEETESWFLADRQAIRTAYPHAKLNKLPSQPDQIIGAAERLGQVIGHKGSITGQDKMMWAERIAPHLDLDTPNSPSFGKFIEGIARHLSH